MRSSAFAIVALLAASGAARAHHSFASEFDEKNCGEFTGTLNSVDWQNPHAYFFIDSKNARGEPARLTFQTLIGRPTAWSRTPPERPKEDPVPFRPEALAKIKSLTRTQLQMLNPTVNCLPRGVPGMFTMNPHPFELVTKPGVFIQLVEAGNQWRKVHTDKRPHPEYPDPLFNGNSSASWDGDTLVIDSVGFDERTWIAGNGWYHSDQLRVIERIRRPSLNYLEYQFTIGDPKVLTKPWTSAWRKFSLAQDDEQLLENYCTNEQNAEQFRKLNELESQRSR